MQVNARADGKGSRLCLTACHQLCRCMQQPQPQRQAPEDCRGGARRGPCHAAQATARQSEDARQGFRAPAADRSRQRQPAAHARQVRGSYRSSARGHDRETERVAALPGALASPSDRQHAALMEAAGPAGVA